MNDFTDEQCIDNDFGPFVGLFWSVVFLAVTGLAFMLGYYWHTLFAY